MPNITFQEYLAHAQKLNDVELVEWTKSWPKQDSMPRVVGEFEIQRRQNLKREHREAANAIRSWVAIAISGFSLLVAIFALLLKK